MNKLLIKLTACAFGLALSSTAVIAADPKYPEKDASPAAAQSDTQAAPTEKDMTTDKSTKSDTQAAPADNGMTPDKSTNSDTQASPSDKPASVAGDKESTPADVKNAYSAALKKCAAMSGAEKQTCEENAKTKRGKM